MHTFEITIQRKTENGWPVIVEQSQSGGLLPTRYEGVLQLNVAELRQQITPLAYGTVLGQALFRDEIRDALIRALSAEAQTIRILLVLEAPDLKLLHWERVCAPLRSGGQWGFLARNQRTPFSFYLPSRTDRLFRPIGRRDLRTLALVAAPENLNEYKLAPFDADQTVASLRAASGAIPCHVLATVAGADGRPTLDDLCKQITAHQYTLLHVVAHGWVDPERETVLYLADANNQVAPVTAARFIERLDQAAGAHGLPHFVFLASCASASPEADEALGGLAQRLVREIGFPAVVAMTEPVSIATAEAFAREFYLRLQDHGEVDRAVVEACAGLADRYDFTAPALYSRLGGRPLFSDTADRPLTNNEISFGLARLDELLPQRAPALGEPFQTHAARLRQSLDTTPESLSKTAQAERDEALAQVNTLCDEALDLSFSALALGQNPPAYDARCPFRGLYPFHLEDREFFFGREALIQQLQQKLIDTKFLAILGPSGSGKSSLVLAGLFPALQKDRANLQMAYLTPGSDPLTQLHGMLAKVDHATAIVVIDQFEEVFTLCTDAQKRQEFLEALLRLPAQLPVVLTMRADFWGECAAYRELKDVLLRCQELIAPMDSAELRRAIERQAKQVGLRFEADLMYTILNDVTGEPGAMPLLQHALLELWRRRHGAWLRAEEYRRIGGVRQAIAETAENVYQGLAADEQARVRDIFLRLTHLDEEMTPGAERRDTRRRVALDELVSDARSRHAIKDLVRRLADRRLLVTSVNAVTGQEKEEVEVAHEALIRHWPRLQRWLHDDRARLRLRAQLGEAAQEWARQSAEEFLIHRGARLEEAHALAQTPNFLNTQEQAYVQACTALQAREQARRRNIARFRLGALSLIGLLVIAALAIGLWSARRDAQRQETIAQQQTEFAEKQKQLRDEAERQTVIAQANATEAQKQKQEAEKQTHIAQANAEEAKKQRAEAVKEQQRAVQQKSIALEAINGLTDDLTEKLGQLPRTNTILTRILEQNIKLLDRILALDPDTPEAQPQKASNLGRLGDFWLALGKIPQALTLYQQSFAIRERLATANPIDTQAQKDLARSYIRLYEVYQRQGELPAALDACQKALSIRERLAAANPMDIEAQYDLATSYPILAYVQQLNRNLQAALDAHQQSFAILEPLGKANPDNTEFQISLAAHYISRGDVQRQLGEFQDALAAYQQGLAINKRLAAADSTNRKVQRNLALSYDRLGDMQQQSDLVASLAAYKQSFAIKERWAAEDPEDNQSQRDLSLTYERLGDMQKKQEDFQAALTSYQKSVEIFKRLAEADPTNTGEQGNLERSFMKLESLAAIFLMQNRMDEALAVYQTQLKFQPNNTKALQELERIGKNLSYADRLKVNANNLALLSNDAELAFVQSDIVRCQSRITAALALAKPDSQLFAILPFYAYLANPAQGWEPVLAAIQGLDSDVKFTWDFSATAAALARLDAKPRQAAQQFIAFFEGKLDLPTLQARLGEGQEGR